LRTRGQGTCPATRVAWVPDDVAGTLETAPKGAASRRRSSLSSSSHSLARSSRALAQAVVEQHRLATRRNTGATKRGQSEPSSAVTRSMSSASLCLGRTGPGCQDRARQGFRRGPPRPGTPFSAGDLFRRTPPSAAESTTPPTAAGRPTAARNRDSLGARPTAADKRPSMTLSTVPASASAPSCRPPKEPPRTLEPSRVPSAHLGPSHGLTQPSPSSQVFLTRFGDVRGPACRTGPSTVRS